MENELRELLERKTADLVAGPEAPYGLLRRARRRRIRTALLTVLVGGALGFGGFFGGQAALDAVRTEGGQSFQPADEGESTPPPERQGEEAVFDFVAAFMEARIIRESGGERFLSAEAKRQYDQGKGGLALYGPVSNPYYAGYETLSLEAVDATSYEVIVRIAEEQYPWPGIEIGSFTETLFIGPGQTYEGEQATLVVRGALRDDTYTFPTEEEASEFIDLFVISRFENDDAERFLSPQAADQYEGGEEGISLYEPSPQFQWASFEVLSIDRKGNQYEVAVHVVVSHSSSGEQDSFTEVILIAPGRTVDDIDARLVVREAHREA